MKLKKLITGMLLMTILIAQISIIPFNNFVYAQDVQTQNSEKFHYQQLDSVAKKIYDGIYDMYTQGILKTGVQTFDLTEDDKYVTQEQLENYMKGNTELKTAMNAAKYAFYVDHPEVFYVNFSNLTLRVTKDAQNRYHANLGAGNLKSYYVEGFTDQQQVQEAITQFEARVDEIAENTKKLTVEENKNLTAEQIKYVHNQIIYNTSYRLESDCDEGNEGFLGTPYGALVKKQAVCEGYARSLKAILDKVGINCILVQGTHQSEGSAAVPHMWNYVQIEKETYTRATEKIWYAVDATLDDPYARTHIIEDSPDRKPGDDIVEGFENTRYCLVGVETMRKEHIALETVEAAGNYTFQYPELYEEDYGIDNVHDKDGLLVKYKQDGTETEEYKSGDYYISYNGKGYNEAAKEGKYMIMKSHYYKPGDEEWQVSPWAYFLPDVYAGGFKDYGDHIYLYVPNSEYVEFAVTTLEPGDYITDITNLAYKGDESDFVARTGKLYNPSGTYKGKPYIKTQTPAPTATLSVGPTYHVEVTYDDDLNLAEGVTEVGYRMESTGSTGAEKSEITNFVFDGKRKVTFDLKFSQMYADDGASYRIYVTGLIGKNSGKEPAEITYGAVNDISCSFRMNKAKNWEVFARPILMENEDLSLNGWKTSDGEEVSEKLKSRIALVATRTTASKKEEMNNLIEEELPSQELITSETYNISLNVCRKYVVKTGHRLRLSLGFPAGYGPDDAGVTFKAYHFITNAAGEVTGVEEIPCVITQYGLIVTCDSFSPFAIAVVKNDGTQVPQEKSVIVSAEEGGVITGANREEGNIITLKENETRDLTVQAEEGYEIETITVCGEVVDMTQIENKETTTLNINYDSIKDGNCIVHATFVAKEVIAAEEQKGEVAVMPVAEPTTVTIPTERIASTNRPLVINAKVDEVEGTIYTYQWYKDGVKLEGKTNKTLTIDEVTKNDAGSYTVKVTTTIGTTSEETQSNECIVTVRGFEISMEASDLATDLQKIKPGEEFEIAIKMNNFTNIGEGLVSLTGQLEYDANLLTLGEITPQNGWKLNKTDMNPENHKFVMENDNRVTSDGELMRVKFTAKDEIGEEAIESIIKLKGVTASGGYGIIGARDAQIAIKVQKPEPEKITSDIYVVNDEDKDISRIAPKTTVAQFKTKVETKQEMVFLDKEGNTLGEDDIIATGMTIKVGETLEYTLVVTGDIDGEEGDITVNDLAQVKLHIIEYKKLTGIALKAGDVDNDGRITINDLAKIKLVLIGSLEIN